MAKIECVKTTRDHIQPLIDRMRKKDYEEIVGLGVRPYRFLWRTYRNSDICNTFLIDGEVAAITSCSGGFLAHVGCVTLLTTEDIYKIPAIRYAKIYRDEIKKYLNMYQKLEGFVKTDYNESIKLLKLMGARLLEENTFGSSDYYRFEINGY